MLVEIELDEGRGPVVVKRPTSGDDRARLRRETAALRAARHPGVVAIVERGDDRHDHDRPLCLRWVGPHSLATTAPFEPMAAAGIVATLAETVADLHDRGLVHTRIVPEHVILGSDGRPVLGGLREAAAAREEPTSIDVAALGRLLVHLLGPTDAAELEPIPDRRRLLGRPRWQGYQRRALLMLADQADAETPASRPSARSFALSLRSLSAHPGRPFRHAARPPARPTPPAAEPAPRARSVPIIARRRLTGAATALGIVVVAFGVAQVLRTPSAATPRTPSTRSSTSLPVTTPSVAPTRPTRPTTTAAPPATTGLPVRMCADPGGSTADVDGDGCPDRLQVRAGAVVAAGVRYRLGEPGDEIVVADWRCTGQATPALLRPGTGEVFVFTSWAGPGRPVTTTPAAVVVGATAIRARRAPGAPCPTLEVARGERAAVVVPVERGR